MPDETIMHECIEPGQEKERVSELDPGEQAKADEAVGSNQKAELKTKAESTLSDARTAEMKAQHSSFG